ncbi:MAG: hypothetical protein V3T75_00070 [candidate division Zixibacteria bacterium]
MTRLFPQLICGFFGVVLFVLYFLKAPSAKSLYLTITSDYWQIIFAFALIVGVASFIRVNIKEVAKLSESPYVITGLLGLFAMPVMALLWGIKGDSPFMWVFENVQVPLQATVFALLAFFVASASLRGFKARSVPATILLISALIALLSRSDIFGWLGHSALDFSEWVRSYPSMSARRGILIGIGLGSVTTSLRVILGIERTWLGKDR